eukprot:4570435-Karenia_brevis.AAC.1
MEVDSSGAQPANMAATVAEDASNPTVAWGAADAQERPKVRPIQMGEFLRKWISRRLLLLNA